MAAARISLLLLCSCFLSTAVAVKPSSLPGFPVLYSATLQLTYYGANSSTTKLSRFVAVDVMNQRQHVDLPETGDEILSFYNKNITYDLNYYGSRLNCYYITSLGIINGSLTFPTVLSLTSAQPQQIDGELCAVAEGMACLQVIGAPADPTKSNPPSICANYTFFSTWTSGLPVRLDFARPDAPQTLLVRAEYVNMSLQVDNSSFVLPPPSSCQAYHTCNTTCSPPGIRHVFGMPLCNVALAPSWILAVVIGIGCAHAVIAKLAKGVVGRVSYSLSFGTYAFMISSGFVVHCIFLTECGHPTVDKQAYALWLLIDEGLTSSIAISFFYNGLVDLRILSEAKAWTYALMLASYVLIFYAYIATTISTFYLYNILIVITCGGYVAMQVLVLLKRGSFKGFGFAIAAGIAGAVGLEVPQHFYCWFCAHFGAWILEPFWYYLSDLSVYLVFCYVMATRDPAPSTLGACESVRGKEGEQARVWEGAGGVAVEKGNDSAPRGGMKNAGLVSVYGSEGGAEGVAAGSAMSPWRV